MFTRKGQNLAEYAVLIAIVIGAAMTMQVYLKRGLQAKQADAMDFRPPLEVAPGVRMIFDRRQYEPYYVESNANIRSSNTKMENIGLRGLTTRSMNISQTTKYSGAYERSNYGGTNPPEAP